MSCCVRLHVRDALDVLRLEILAPCGSSRALNPVFLEVVSFFMTTRWGVTVPRQRARLA